MNRADQHVLLQETNLGVLDIRQSELDYRIDLNTAFGTQAALIGGFSYGVYSQNPLNENTTYSGTFLDLYWAVSAVTIACAIHIILTTMALQVLGPGLTLNGPVGSMAKANDGLRIEQQPVVISFLIMMIFFAISTVLGFWSTFNFYPALISTVIFMVACRYWYVYTERIYLRFYWEESESRWNVDDRNSFLDSSISISPGNTSSGQKKKSILRFINVPRVFKRASLKKQTELNSAIISTETTAQRVSLTSDILMEGYLLKKGSYSTENSNESWERRYFTLNRRANLYLYKSRLDYRADPTKPMYIRPIELSDYIIEIFNSEDDNLPADDTQSTTSASKRLSGLPRATFQMTLYPDEQSRSEGKNNWIFRCDTEEELEAWVTVIRQLLPENFK